jgi:hypothetical protein
MIRVSDGDRHFGETRRMAQHIIRYADQPARIESAEPISFAAALGQLVGQLF